MKKILTGLVGVIFIISSCVQKPTTSPEKIENAQYYYKIGISYLEAGNNSQALYYLNKAYQINPNDPEILNALGIAYSNVEEFKKAEKFLLKAIEKNPDRAETYTNLGIILAKEKKYDKALWYFKKAAENPSYMKKDLAYYNMALIYKNLGNLKLYEENLKKALSYNSFLLPAYISLGELYLSQTRYKDALAVYLLAKEKGLSNPYIYFGIGKVYYFLDQPEKAKEYLLRAKKLAKDNEFLVIQIDNFIKKVDKKLIEEAEKNIEIPQKTQIPKTIPEKEENKVTEKQAENAEKSRERSITSPQQPLIAKIPEEKPKIIKPVIKFYVLVGRFSDKKRAIDLFEKLKSKGFNPEMKTDFVDGKPIYSVIIGYFDEYRKASRFYRKKLRPLGLRGIVKFVRK